MLADAYRATREQKYLDGALHKFRIGVAPGQVENGRWIDFHNARTVYHLIILRAMNDLYAVAPEEVEPFRAKAVAAIMDEFSAMGVTDKSFALRELSRYAASQKTDEPRLRGTIALTAAVVCGRSNPALTELAALSLLAPVCVGSSPVPLLGESRSFLYAGEGAKTVCIYDAAGKVAWEYPVEMSRDAWRLPNGNVLFAYNNNYDSKRNDNPSGVMEVTPDKKIVFDFKTTGQVWACQRLANGNTLVGAASQGKLLVVEPKGAIVKTIALKNKPGHSCIRYARGLANGNFLVAEESSNTVREYGSDGALEREIPLEFRPFAAVRLTNGNTLVTGKSAVVEVDAANKIVWRLDATEVPQLGVRWFAGVQALPNGNLFICNAGGKVPVFEISRDKRVVWQSDAAISIGHGAQRLDVTEVLR